MAAAVPLLSGLPAFPSALGPVPTSPSSGDTDRPCGDAGRILQNRLAELEQLLGMADRRRNASRSPRPYRPRSRSPGKGGGKGGGKKGGNVMVPGVFSTNDFNPHEDLEASNMGLPDNLVTRVSDAITGFTKGHAMAVGPDGRVYDNFTGYATSCLLYTSPSPRD